MQFKKKSINSKNELDKIQQVNEKLRQKLNKLKTINRTILFYYRKYLFRSFLSIESTYHRTLSINNSISVKKSTKHFDSEFFISYREDFQ